MRRILVLGLFALGLGVIGVAAQDRFFAFRGAFVDVIVTDPCGGNGLKGAVTMTVYDRNAWLVYTCNDDRVILRRYFNPNDNAVPPTTPQPPAAPQSATITCPADPHAACKMLPAGVYDRAWADTVAR